MTVGCPASTTPGNDVSGRDRRTGLHRPGSAGVKDSATRPRHFVGTMLAAASADSVAATGRPHRRLASSTDPGHGSTRRADGQITRSSRTSTRRRRYSDSISGTATVGCTCWRCSCSSGAGSARSGASNQPMRTVGAPVWYPPTCTTWQPRPCRRGRSARNPLDGLPGGHTGPGAIRVIVTRGIATDRASK